MYKNPFDDWFDEERGSVDYEEEIDSDETEEDDYSDGRFE